MPRLNTYIIAGEPSGDRLGGALITALNERADLSVHGVGGQDMQAAGLKSLFDMADLTVMGLSEVLPRLPLILRRIRQTADDIIARRPDVLITIDSPDFTLRVAARVRRSVPDLKVVHYVAPSVWAWRPGRAAKMARHVDHVLALLPFEPPYMEAAGMTCDCVGHPVAGRPVVSPGEVAAFREEQGLQGPLFLLAPGSRRGEVRRLSPDFRAALELIRGRIPDLQVLCPVAETVQEQVRAALGDVPGIRFLSPDTDDATKRRAFAAADAALCASGTITLELAAAGTPMVAAYRTTWLTAQIVRRVVQVNSANLVNLISERIVVPEFLQEFCTPEALADAVTRLLTDPSAAAAQTNAFDRVMHAMGRGGPAPEARAADAVLGFLRGEKRIGDLGALTGLPGPAGRHQGRV